ncbi:MAG: hypothetical protein BWX86_03013 [Verrucomicrobia bacterium ADurb.Bin122]|nr:MAG: hypothetical protein BWX86_03013 [Verrucomicrobia bacterium ADurb.Bin122]
MAETGGLVPLKAADGAGGFEPVHFGHLHVHKNKIVVVLAERGDGFEAATDEGGLVAVILEETQGDLLVHDIVLGHEDARGGAERGGRLGAWLGDLGRRCGVRGGGRGDPERVQEGVAQAGFGDGFELGGRDTVFLQLLGGGAFFLRGEQEYGGRGWRWDRVEGVRELQAVGVRHWIINEDELVGSVRGDA